MQRRGRPRRLVYMLAPLLFLVVCLGSINFISWWAGQRALPTDPLAATAVSTAQTAVVPSAPPTATPTKTATPAPTPPPTQTLPPNAEIALLGPPANTTLTTAATISFYWMWPLPPSEDHHFAVYWINENGEQLLGVQEAPNLGRSYYLSVTLSQPAVGAWQVRLQEKATQQTIRSSAQRPLTVQVP